MGYNILYSDIYAMMWDYKENIDSNISHLNSLKTNINLLINEEKFQGSSATAMKSYYSEVQIPIIEGYIAAAQNVLDAVAMYSSSYLGFDGSTGMKIEEDSLLRFKESCTSRCETALNNINAINTARESIVDLVPSEALSTEAMTDSYDNVVTHIGNVDTSVGEIETQIQSHLQNETNALISSVNSSVNIAVRCWGNATAYQSGMAAMSQEFAVMEYATGVFNDRHESLNTDLTQFWDTMEDYKVAAEQREEAGVWQAIGAGALIITGVVCIVCTAGAATPAVAAAGMALGGGTLIFGVSDMCEAGENIYLGSQGNITDEAGNPLRDDFFRPVFGEKGDVIYFWTETAFATGASAMCPIANVANKGGLTLKTGAMLVGREVVSTGAGMGSGYLAGWGMSKLTDNQSAINTVSMLTSMAVGYGTSKAGQKIYDRAYTNMLLDQSTCTPKELEAYLQSRIDWAESKGKTDLVEKYTKDLNNYTQKGIWNNELQIPKSADVLMLDPTRVDENHFYGGYDWDKAPEGGYVLNGDGDAIKNQTISQEGWKIDRYGDGYGTYVSPVTPENGKFAFDQRSLPYIEDYRQYHTYNVNVNIPDSYIGEISAVPGFGSGGGIQIQMPENVNSLVGNGSITETNKLNYYNGMGGVKGVGTWNAQQNVSGNQYSAPVPIFDLPAIEIPAQ